MSWHINLNQLHSILVDLYDTVDDARRLADQSGLERSRINFQGSTNNVWHNVLLEAARCHQIHTLIACVDEEYPAHAPLREAMNQIHHSSQPPALPLSPGAENQNGTTETADPDDDLDEVATRRYGVEGIAQPTLGHLARITQNYTLPQTLPIYQLESGCRKPRYLRIGRHRTNNTLVLRDQSVSREHALFAQNAGKLYLRDNGSSLGTYLNWRRLETDEELLVRSGDLISFGKIVYEFIAADATMQGSVAM